MRLAPGMRVGPFEVSAAIGAGGMGEVYRARDGRLNRDVALKVLPDLFSADPGRLARFTREAQLLATLNHQNIAAVYGLEPVEASGTLAPAGPALVLELVEGPTLADRIAAGPLQIEDALAIARQIVDALEAAHALGIVHRDLKPSNIKVRADGVVKVLDFGLAKALGTENSGSSSGPENTPQHVVAPTVTSPVMMTGIGVVLGTAAYMAPEQAKGRPADRRADVWAFGCVLYEMLTGCRAFPGNDVSDTLAHVLLKDPAWQALPESTPPAIGRLLRRCLRKDPSRRLKDISDARLDIEEALDPSAGGEPGPARAPARGTPVARILPWAIAAATSALAIVALFGWAPRRDAQGLRPVVFDIPAAGPAAYMSISPDGQKIVYAANPETEARTVLWLRALDRSAAIRLQGTEGATSADWSPDSRFVIYASQNRLLKLDVSGGPPQVLTLLPNSSLYQRATWNRRGDIVFSAGGRLHRVRDSGGEPIELSQPDATLEEAYHATPWFLPDGRRFLYSAWSSNPERRSIYIGSLDGSPRVRLMHSEGKVMYAGGRLVFVRAGTLVVQPFDPDSLMLSGEPTPLLEQVAFNTDTGAAAFHVSENGTLIYRRGGGLLATTRELVWIGRDGRRGTPLGLETSSPSIALSPDGKKLATFESPQAVSSDIWIIDLERGVRTRLTNDAATDSFPVWSPDGAEIIFYSNRGGRGGLFRKPASGATSERPLLVGDFAESMRPRGWSTDGRSLIVERAPFGAFVVRDLVVLDMPENEAAPRERRYVTTPFDEGHAAVSPDGRWVAYASNEPGTYQVFVQPFPDAAGGKWQISTRGGLAPRWRRDSKELYYIRRDGMLVAVPVGSGAGSDFSPGRETVLFPFPFGFSEGQLPDPAVPYDVSPDGERFLMSVPATASSSITSAAPISVILNWPARLQPR